MNDLWSVIIFFWVIITVIDTIVTSNKKSGKRTRKQKPIKVKNMPNQEDRPIYKAPETIHTKNIGCIKWDENFLKSLEWKRFEEVCMEYLRIKNCNANVTCIGADGGIDIKISDSNGKVFAIAQCKSFSNKKISVSLIRELYGVMAAEGAKHGIFLTTSTYYPPALEFAEGKKLMLIDGNEIINQINSLKDDDKKRIDEIATAGDYTTPTCARCNIKMVRRKSNNTGKEFWGCVNFPKCRSALN